MLLSVLVLVSAVPAARMLAAPAYGVIDPMPVSYTHLTLPTSDLV